MMKIKKYINRISSLMSAAVTALAALTLASSCQSEDYPVQQPDNYGLISFGVSSQQGEELTRSTYRDWSATTDPVSLGVYGYHDLTNSTFTTASYCMFSNVPFDYSSSAKTWNYRYYGQVGEERDDRKYWFDYNHFRIFDFFGYMPYSDAATLVNEEGTESYTLSFPVDYTKPILKDSDNPSSYGLICNAPNHTDRTDKSIMFDMDQLTTGFKLKFQLGTVIDGVRDFKIKKVAIYGSFPYKGTVSRTYTYDSTSDSWTSGDVTWSSTTTKDYTQSSPYEIYSNADGLSIGSSSATTLEQTGTDGDLVFYAIPSGFKPTIQVTYDVYTDGSTVTTRKDVTSEIVFSPSESGNPFYSSNSLKVGTIVPILINIVPSYLYVLADADQAQGYIVMQ